MGALLRRFGPADGAALAAVLGDTEVMRHSDAGPLGLDDIARWLDRARAPAPRRRGYWAVLDRGGDCVGYAHLTADLTRIAPEEVELGLRLARAAQGQGLGLRVVSELCALAGRDPALRRVVALVDPANLPSRRLFARAGFEEAGRVMLPGYDHPDLVLAREIVSSSGR